MGEQTTAGIVESSTELASNIESQTTDQSVNMEESEGLTVGEDVVTESIDNADGENESETLTTESNEGIDQAEEISTTISSDTEDHTESSTDIIEEGVTSEEGDNQTTQNSISPSNEESDLVSTTENDLDSLPEAECDPSSCEAPAGFEFCQPLPVAEGECCPSQYECNLSTTTDGPTTTIIVSVSEDDSQIPTTTAPDTEDHTEVVTESIDNADGESEGETLTTETSIGESNEGIDQAEEISTTISSDTEDHTESSNDISEDGATTQTSISPSNEELDLVTTTENDLDSLPEAECDPSSCEAPAGYEFCQPLPNSEGECCPSQYECNLSTTTDGPTTTIIVSVSEDNSEISTTISSDTEDHTE